MLGATPTSGACHSSPRPVLDYSAARPGCQPACGRQERGRVRSISLSRWESRPAYNNNNNNNRCQTFNLGCRLELPPFKFQWINPVKWLWLWIWHFFFNGGSLKIWHTVPLITDLNFWCAGPLYGDPSASRLVNLFIFSQVKYFKPRNLDIKINILTNHIFGIKILYLTTKELNNLQHEGVIFQTLDFKSIFNSLFQISNIYSRWQRYKD